MTDKEQARLQELLQAEQAFRAGGARVAGMDEVGRGPLAGPVTVACVALAPEPLIAYVNDSKKVTARRRLIAEEMIREQALALAVESVDAAQIDQMNILNATKLAMRRAAVAVSPDVLLVDAVQLSDLPFACHVIIGGDGKCYSIAAASIVAKVARDAYMVQMDAQYPQYGFARNKGYGTAEHIAALKKYGPCPIHRMSFLKNILK
jgi:ribonuclease HII